MRGGWIYILTNRPNGTLYIGVTSNLIQRVWQHREGVVPGFTKRYGLKRLVYFEAYDDISVAIQREKNVKHWPLCNVAKPHPYPAGAAAALRAAATKRTRSKSGSAA